MALIWGLMGLVVIGLLIWTIVLVTSAQSVPVVSNTYPVGVTPSGISITPDGKYAYVANSNNYGISGSDSVTVLDLIRGVVLTTITDPSFNQPYTVTIDSTGTYAYVTNSGSPSVSGQSGTISIVTIATNTVTGTISGFNGPSGLVIVGNNGYVNEYGAAGSTLSSGMANTVKVVDMTTKAITHTITVGLAPAAITATLDGKFVYVANYTTGLSGAGSVSVIDTSTNTVTKTITGFFGPFSIVIPNTKNAYVSNFGSNNFSPYGTTISVIDLATNTITSTINVGIQPSPLAFSKKYLFVGNYNSLYASPSTFENLTYGEGTVNVIDLATNKVLAPTIKVGQSPAGLAVSPTTGNLYCTGYTSNTVSEVRVSSVW